MNSTIAFVRGFRLVLISVFCLIFTTSISAKAQNTCEEGATQLKEKAAAHIEYALQLIAVLEGPFGRSYQCEAIADAKPKLAAEKAAVPLRVHQMEVYSKDKTCSAETRSSLVDAVKKYPNFAPGPLLDSLKRKFADFERPCRLWKEHEDRQQDAARGRAADREFLGSINRSDRRNP